MSGRGWVGECAGEWVGGDEWVWWGRWVCWWVSLWGVGGECVWMNVCVSVGGWECGGMGVSVCGGYMDERECGWVSVG